MTGLWSIGTMVSGAGGRYPRALWVFFATQSDVFLTARNLLNLLVQSTVVGIMALGLMFVLLVKEIDLSVAAINGVTSVLMANLIVEIGVSPQIAIPLVIGFGAMIGMSSARWVTWVGVPSFVVTLGLGLALNGIQLLLPDTARYSLMNTGIDKIALAKVTGVWSWIVFALMLAAFAGLIFINVARRQRAGLAVNLSTELILSLVGGAAFGALVVSILNAYQGLPVITLVFAILLGLGGYVLREDALQAAEIERFRLVVHDIVGPIGFDLAARHPDRILSLTALNTIVDVVSFHRTWIMEPFAWPVIDRIWLASMNTPALWVLMRYSGMLGTLSYSEIMAYGKLLKRGDGGRAFLEIMRGFERTEEFETRIKRGLRARTYPAQVIWGRRDPALGMKKMAPKVCAALGLTTWQEVNGKHFLQEDSFDRIAEEISNLAASH